MLGSGLLDSSIDVVAEIKRLRDEKNAVILAHYYQDGAIQDIADFVGDSLDLSKKAAETDADMIVFCGVRFMAEVAKILSPEKKVVLPDLEAGCSLEDSCPPAEFAEFKKQHPDHMVLSYINCSAEIKTMSDIIVTSSNAEYIVSQIPAEQKLIFAPDRHLGGYLSKTLNRDMVLWQGTCMVHELFSEKELIKLKAQHPNAPVLVHPECPDAIVQHADVVGSTRKILNAALNSESETLIIATEPGIIHQMEKAAPHKTFIGAPGADGNCSCNTCPYMALNTMEKLYLCLKNEGPEIGLDEATRLEAEKPLRKMLEMSEAMVASQQATVKE
ncbi:quinolinate synthase NadA [Temperatibacter marinus]